MRAFKRFWYALHGWRVRTAEPSPYGKPGVYEDDARHILRATLAGKWADVEYYGPGAAEANERRAATLGLTPKVEPQAAEPARKKRRRLSKKERLEKQLRKLQADVEKLEKGEK